MILIINTCNEKLHYLEFVKPVEEIIENLGEEYSIRHYKNLTKADLENSNKIIICGTSLQDDEFLVNLKKFDWIKTSEKPLLGICAGFQIIGLVFGGVLKKQTEIGFYFEYFLNNFLGLKGKQEVYHLHNNFVNFSQLSDFEIFCKSGEISQAVKHKSKNIFGVLFHPEVRQKDLIRNFIKIGF